MGIVLVQKSKSLTSIPFLSSPWRKVSPFPGLAPYGLSSSVLTRLSPSLITHSLRIISARIPPDTSQIWLQIPLCVISPLICFCPQGAIILCLSLSVKKHSIFAQYTITILQINSITHPYLNLHISSIQSHSFSN